MNYPGQLLGWVLEQVAWQTLAVALLLALAMSLMRGASAAQRYRCAVMHLVAAVGAVVLTLVVSHLSVAAGSAVRTANNAPPGLADHARSWLPALAWCWLSGIALAQALIVVRFLGLRRFISRTTPAARDIAARVEEMSFEIGLDCAPEVRCADVRSPMVAGWRSAVLVLPRTFGETHPPAERRALLAHELAHVLRRDYFRNILQLLAASVLWWHPAVWLIFARIKHERECSSDEQAVRLTGSATALASALLRLAGASLRPETVVMAADSAGLADRITRILQPRTYPAGETARPLPAGVFAALTALAAAFMVTAGSSAPHREALTRAYAASAIGPPTMFTIRARDPAGHFLVKMVRGRVVEVVLEQEPGPRARVVQQGDTVRVLSGSGQELLRLEVDPRGGLRWNPRRVS